MEATKLKVVDNDPRPYERTAPRKHDLPKGVYWFPASAKYGVKTYDAVRGTEYHGLYDTVEEAHYVYLVKQNGHHWQGMPQDLSLYFGFTYEMEHIPTGRKYIGSKQFHFWDGPQGGYKCTEPTHEDWNPALWRESDWHVYKSSATGVAKSANERPHEWSYRVIGLHANKLTLNLNEVLAQIDANVLKAVDENGEYIYLNGNIMGKEYRPAVPMAKLKEQIADTKSAMEAYYLKPQTCENCGTLIPFGVTRCPNAPMFGNGDCDEERRI